MFAGEAATRGLMDQYQAAMLQLAAKAASEAALELSPEEEYYVGRAVAATILATYPPYDHRELNVYLNLLGQGLAVHSERPEIFAGYRFLALESDEVNAFASPGGHILVTRGLLKLAESEDELAAILAHEIAHTALKHGIGSVQGARLAAIVSKYAISAGSASGGSIAAFTEAFGAAISEIATIILISGYSQSYELAADLEAARILAAAGYDPEALTRLVARLPAREGQGVAAGTGFAVTHPDPSTRTLALSEAETGRKSRASPARKFQDPMGKGDDVPEDELPSPLEREWVRKARFECMRMWL
jgi:predicted Zn-dependent protease